MTDDMWLMTYGSMTNSPFWANTWKEKLFTMPKRQTLIMWHIYAGVYILPFLAFYYSAIFSALQLFTELFFIGYSKFFVYLHPTPLLNAKLIRFGPLLTKNHYFFNFFNQKSLILLKKIGKNPFFPLTFSTCAF